MVISKSVHPLFVIVAYGTGSTLRAAISMILGPDLCKDIRPPRSEDPYRPCLSDQSHYHEFPTLLVCEFAIFSDRGLLIATSA